MKKRIKPTNVELDPIEDAILVYYTVEIQHIDSEGEVIKVISKL